MDGAFTFTAVGLAYDGFDVAILGFAFFSKSIDAMMIESGTYWGGNDALLQSLIQSRTDGITGTSLLMAGFIMHWLGANGMAIDVVGKSLVALLAAFLLLYFVFLRKFLNSRQLSKGQELRQEHLQD